jgi:hypothetical protein
MDLRRTSVASRYPLIERLDSLGATLRPGPVTGAIGGFAELIRQARHCSTEVTLGFRATR